MRDRESVRADGRTPSSEAKVPAHFGGLILDVDACTLARESGEAIPLTRGEFALLRFFVTHPWRVLSRDTLLDVTAGRRLEPFDRSVDVMVGRLRRKIEPDPKAPRLIVTVAGVGYQFATAVRKAIAAPEREEAALNLARLGASASLLAQEVTAPREKSGPPRFSIVVLPFANIGGDPEQEYFADGVTESLTTDLSRISGAFVIGRSTAFAYKNKAVDLKRIGRELNVRYVLEGSVQRSRKSMRVNVQLLEAETGAHLWAERFDKPIADLFDMQDEIVARLANQLQVELIDAEARRVERTTSPDSMDLCFQGRAILNHGVSPGMLAKARALFERALELDPGNVAALVGLGTVDATMGAGFMTDDPASNILAAEANLTKALSLAPNHAIAHRVMGFLLCATNRALRGMEELERALAIDRNHARAHGFMAYGSVFVGRAEDTEAHVLEALRLSPHDAYAYLWFLHVGVAKACLGKYEEALPWLQKSVDENRNAPWGFFYLAVCLAHLGRLDEAQIETQAGLAVDPKFTIRRFCALSESNNEVFLAQRKRVTEGLRLAGVPEG